MKAITWTRRSVWVAGCMVSALVHAQSLVGRMAGEPGVSATGAARYATPLTLPPGTNGLAPSLAIAYDSRGGNGLLGAGFQLNGFSVIQRCERTLAQDGAPGGVALDAGDRFCLDGKRLRLTSGSYGYAGSQYQTEVEEFSRVTAYGVAGNGPAYFRVDARDGLIYEYGATANSRIESVGTTTARTWALNRVRDRSGNYIDFVYTEDTLNGSYRPSRIDYTGNTAAGAAPYYSVRFYYEPRPATDASSGFFAGGPVIETQRLDRIEVLHSGSGTVVRRFDVSYASTSPSGRSRLASVQECSATECLPATSFVWEPFVFGWSWWDVGTTIGVASAVSVIPGDTDGDGCEDLTYFDTVAGRWFVLRGNAVGYAGPAVNVAAGSATTAAGAVSIDLDSDGKRDLLLPGYSLTAGATWWWLHHVSGSTYAYTATGMSNVSELGGTIAADIDGDGRDDIVYAKKSSSSIFWRRNLTAAGVPAFAAEAVLWTSAYASASPATPFGTNAQRFRSIVRRGDFNGDARTDLLFMQQYSCGSTPGCSGTRTEWHALFSQGNTLTTRAVVDSTTIPLLGDFNGDGLTDVSYPTVATDGSVSWSVRFGTGSASSSTAAFTAAVATSATAPVTGTTVLDWDGDGRTDLLYPTAASGWQFCRSTGTTIGSCTSAGSIAADITGSPLATDINGDGITDIVFPTTDWRYRLRQPGQADVLSSATDGFGNVARFTYSTLANRSVHTPGIGSVFPVREYFAPLPVVSRLTRSDGIGGTFVTSMTYEGARLHLQGRGFLGFSRRTATDSRTGLARVEDYLQDPNSFELIGRPSMITLRLSNGSPVDRQTFTWSKLLLGAGADSRRFPYVATLVSDRFELDGAKVTSTTTNSTHDSYGTLTDRTSTLTEVARGSNPGAQHVERVSLSSVVNDTTNWCLGRATSVVVRRSHTLPGGAQIARTVDHAWDAARCRPTQTIVEPSSLTLRVVTDVTYDAFGNRASTTVTPVGQVARRTAYVWTENGRFPGTVDAPEAHLITTTWNPITAQRTQARDPNGRLTQWRYDSLNRLTGQIEPDGTSSTVTRSLCSGSACAWPGSLYLVRQTRSGLGNVYLQSQDTGFDALDRPVSVKQEQPGGGYTLSVQRFDARGLLAQQSVPGPCCSAPSRWVTYAYDALGRMLSMERPTSEVIPTALVTRLRYDGLNVVQTDPLGRMTTHRADAVGNVLQVVDEAGADTDYDYDAFGNLLKVRDFAGNETNLTYNVNGMRTRVVDPDAGTWTYDYTALGELKSQTNARGQKGTYTYDQLGRPISRAEPEGVTTWAWGHSSAAFNIGALASVSSPGFQESYTYDSSGRPTAVTRSVAGSTLVTSYSYDAATGLLDTLTYPTVTGVAPFRLKHVFDRGRLVRLVDAGSPASVYWQLESVNAAGQTAAVALGNGVKVASSHDAITGLLTSRTTGPSGGTSLQNLRYTWDAVGNLKDRSDVNRGVVEQFTYDTRDRLDLVQRAGVTTLDLAYDDLGNVTYKSDIGAYRYDAVRKHAVVAAGSNTYAYDANGAVTNASGSSIGWYSYDLPSQITHPNGNYSAFYYGADRARYRQVARAGTNLTDTLYAADGRYERYARGGVVSERQYVVADGGVVAVRNRSGSAQPTTTYLLHDHLGGVDGFTSASGSLLAKASYHPMGARRSGDWLSAAPTAAEWQQIQATTARGYTGHEHLDNLGIIHMNGRVLDPALGRFLSPDPYVQSPYDSQSLNRYSYVRNNPLRFTDPSGYCFNGHPGADQEALQCLEQIMVNATRFSDFQASLFELSAQASSLMQGAAEAAAVSGADLAAANAAVENIVVTAPRDEPPNMFAIDATLYAPLPRWLTDVANSSFGKFVLFSGLTAAALLEPTPIGETALTAEIASDARALSTIRYTRPGEKFLRYESNNRTFTRVTPTGGVRPGTFAAPSSDGLVPISGRASMYNLPDPLILRTESFILRPPPNTMIIGPRPVMGGPGNEVLFPFGY